MRSSSSSALQRTLRFDRGWVAVLFGLLAFVLTAGPFARIASAQTAAPTVVVNPTVTRFNGDGNEATTRAQNLNPTGVNFDDCSNDLSLSFNLTLAGDFNNYRLQAWAGGTDCGPLTARTGTTATCWPLLGQDITKSATVTVAIRARDLVAYTTASTKPTTYTPANESACYSQQQSGVTTVGVYFLWLDGTGNLGSQAQAYNVATDLRGPAAPTNITTEIGQAVTLKFAVATDTDIQGFKAYCNPPPGEDAVEGSTGSQVVETCPDATASASTIPDAEASDAEATDAEPSDAGTTSTPASSDAGCTSTIVPPTACSSSVFGAVDGGQAKIDKRFLCGEVGGGTTSSMIIKNLKQGVTYTIAVAATDGIDNVGPLSEGICATPVQVDDFWISYKQSGGEATSLCALEAVGMPVSGSAGFLIFGATLITYARRRKNR